MPRLITQTVIFDNAYHVSEDVWDECDRGTLKCYYGSRHLRTWVFSEAQKELLHMT